MPARYMDDVLPSLATWRGQGIATALVTLVAVDGSAPRPLGSQMAVNAHGEAVGNITGGCAEAAIIAEARDCIERRANRQVRYGAGSPYIDIRLPCGSGIEVFFDVLLGDDDLHTLLEARRARRITALGFDLTARRAGLVSMGSAVAAACGYVRVFEPVTRVLAVGKGPVLHLVAELGRAAEMEVIAISPEAETLDIARAHAHEVRRITTAEAFRCGELDEQTAFLSLFHEHEWEDAILAAALSSRCFYIGALGSRRTAAARREMLAAAGFDAAAIARIHGPVGLPIGARSPPEIALAILAEIVATRRGASKQF